MASTGHRKEQYSKPIPGNTFARKTLVEQAGEPNVRDPAAHAKRQVEELDKTAKRSQNRRKKTQESIEADNKEIAQLQEQIDMLKVR